MEREPRIGEEPKDKPIVRILRLLPDLAPEEPSNVIPFPTKEDLPPEAA